MKLSIVIPVLNEEKYIGRCLEALIRQTEKAGEIIVVDNGSTDNTVEIVKKFPVKLLFEKKKGTIYARNKGFNAAKYDIIGRIDADTQVPPNWVKDLKNYFESDRSIVAYSGATLFQDRRFNKFLAFPEKMFIASFKKVIGGDLLYGPNMAITKKAWEKLKKVVCSNDKLVHEDLDIAIHLHEMKLGKVVFNPRFTVQASERRWKKIMPYLEYPYRYLTTVQQHKKYLSLKKRTSTILFPSTKYITQKITSNLKRPMKYFN